MWNSPPSPLTPQTLRDDLPRYPILLQLLRVTAGTIPGPSGYASASVTAPNLYVAAVQQLRSDTLLPRDREPCLANDVNRAGLAPGYYLGRLAGSYQSLPVYEVVGAAAGVPVILPGVTPEQYTTLVTNLTPAQLAVLNNLNACQLQTLLELAITDIQRLTSNLTPTQLGLLIDGLTPTQIKLFVTTTTTAQTLVVTSAYPQTYQSVYQALTTSGANTLLSLLTSQQFSTLVNLNVAQLQIVGQLTATQLQTLTGLTATQVSKLVGQLTPTQLTSLLDTLTSAQLRLLTNGLTSKQIEQILQATTPTRLKTLVEDLTPTQLQALAKYAPSTTGTLLDNLTNAQIKTLLDLVPFPPSPVLGSANLFPMVPAISARPSSVPSPALPGYAPVVVDSTGNLWAYISGVWTSLTGGSSSPTLPSVEASNDVTGQSGPALVVNTAEGSGHYRVGGYVNITAISGDTLQLQLSYTDETSTIRSIILTPQGAASPDLSSVAVYLFPSVTFRITGASTILLEVIQTVSGGSNTWNAGGVIERLS